MNFLRKYFDKIILFLMPAIMLALMQFIETSNILNIFNFVGNNFLSFLFSYVILFGILIFFSVIFNSTFVGNLIVGVLMLTLAWVSGLKNLETGEVLTILDFNFGKGVGEIALLLKPATLLNTKVLINFAIIIAVIVCCILLRKHRVKFNIWTRLIVIICVPLIIFLTMFLRSGRQIILSVLGNEITSATSINKMHENNGLLASLYLEYAMQKEESSAIEDLYSKKKIYSILDGVKITKEKELEVQPNVIVIMSEAFMDITKLPNIEFSADPMPTIRKLMNDYISGTSITGSYGKNTSNIEFELFSGNSLKFLPDGFLPYRDEPAIFGRDIYSMPKEFKKAGYSTVALHTWTGEFYNRDVVYPQIGFDKFLARESFENAEMSGRYIGDEYLMKQVIKEFEETSGPKFIFALTMQNHYPYATEYYRGLEPEVIAKSDKLNRTNLDKLQGYVNGLCDVDDSVKLLIEYLETQDEPTIVLFYGDHYPLMTAMYAQIEYISDSEPNLFGEELYKMRTIPFFIYNNFNYQEDYPKFNNITWNKLGSFLLSYAGIDKPVYYHFVDSLNYKVAYDRLFIDENDKIYLEPTYKYLKELENYKLLQYDILYGEQYIKEWENENK